MYEESCIEWELRAGRKLTVITVVWTRSRPFCWGIPYDRFGYLQVHRYTAADEEPGERPTHLYEHEQSKHRQTKPQTAEPIFEKKLWRASTIKHSFVLYVNV